MLYVGVGLLLLCHALGGALGSVAVGASYVAEGGYSSAMVASLFVCLAAALAALSIHGEPLRRRPEAEHEDERSLARTVAPATSERRTAPGKPYGGAAHDSFESDYVSFVPR